MLHTILAYMFYSNMVDSDSLLHQHTLHMSLANVNFRCFQTLALAFMVAASALHPVHPLTTVSPLLICGHSCPVSCNAFLSILAHHALRRGSSCSLSLGVLTWSASSTLSKCSWDKQNSSSNTSSQDMAHSRMGLLMSLLTHCYVPQIYLIYLH